MSSRLKVLFLTHRLPFEPNRGDRTRAYHILKTISAEADVSLVSLVHDAAEAAEAPRLNAFATRTIVAPIPHLANRMRAALALMSARPLTGVLLESPALLPGIRSLIAEDPPDVVLAYCSSMAGFALVGELRRFPLVIDMVDADSAKWLALARNRRWPMNWLYRREARTLALLEAEAMGRASVTVAVNSREVKLLRAVAPAGRIEVVGIGVDVARFEPRDPPVSSPRVVFTGVMNYEPNEAGAIWLARHVWPLVRRAIPDAELRIVGASPTRRVEALHEPRQSVCVTGTIPDVRPELWGAAVGVAPLHTARGVQNKVLEAVAAGLPCVVTQAVESGLPGEVLSACLTADTEVAFAECIVRVLQKTPAERRHMAAVDMSALTWERRLAPLLPLLREAAAGRRQLVTHEDGKG